MADSLPVPVEESVMRFPSSPLVAGAYVDSSERHASRDAQRASRDAQFHSYRVLRPAVDLGAPIRRIFLLHAGLNERSDMQLYYQLSSHLFAQRLDTACIIRPFPEHLSRGVPAGFSDSPLDSYLDDSTRLVRHFLGYMIETQWFLSVLARRSVYRTVSGVELLAASSNPSRSRLVASHLARAIAQGRSNMRRHDVGVGWRDADAARTAAAEVGVIRDCVQSVRDLLRLDADYPPQGNEPGDEEKHDEPAIHVVGYSLGGFVAQAALMSWPYLVSSCTSVLSSPTLWRHAGASPFAHPEEWQTVLESLTNSTTLGLSWSGSEIEDEDGLLGAFVHVFRHAFGLGENGPYKSWLEANRRRMLFVVGGDDPIIRGRPSDVPSGGINLLEIGGLSHFATRPRSTDENPTFWLGEIARLTDRFADRAAAQHLDQRKAVRLSLSGEAVHTALKASGSSRAEAFGRMTIEDRRLGAQDGALDAEGMELRLDDLVAHDDGFVFILSNDIPDFMMVPEATLREGAALYHDDEAIIRHCQRVRQRATALRQRSGSASFTVPRDLRRRVEHGDALTTMLRQSETIAPYAATEPAPMDWQAWVETLDALTPGEGMDSVRVFDTRREINAVDLSDVSKRLLAHASEFAGREEVVRVTTLPDIWVWIAPELLGSTASWAGPDEAIASVVVGLGADYERWYRELAHERIVVIERSRARYNPRYRGRVVADPRGARRVLLHGAICVALGVGWRDCPDWLEGWRHGPEADTAYGGGSRRR
jgi:hypothetical protein